VVAVGSQSKVSLVDQRTQKVEFTIDSHDGNWGVRSVGFFHDMVTIGGGAGRLAFYDLRNKAFLTDEANKIVSEDQEERVFIKTPQYSNAIYTHAFDTSGTRLFVGGGPLMNGFSGCYASLWC